MPERWPLLSRQASRLYGAFRWVILCWEDQKERCGCKSVVGGEERRFSFPNCPLERRFRTGLGNSIPCSRTLHDVPCPRSPFHIWGQGLGAIGTARIVFPSTRPFSVPPGAMVGTKGNGKKGRRKGEPAQVWVLAGERDSLEMLTV